MLYDYASAWQGKRKVRATMKSICTWLLDDLREKRKAGFRLGCLLSRPYTDESSRQGGSEITRSLIIIGHSMGGIVAAKVRFSQDLVCVALTCPDTLHSQREKRI